MLFAALSEYERVAAARSIYATAAYRGIPVRRFPGGMRFLSFEDGNLVEQNPCKASTHAAEARAGYKIAWFIPNYGGGWTKINGGR